MKEIQKVLGKLKGRRGVIELPLSIPGIILCSISYTSNGYYRIYLRVEPQSLIKEKRTIDVFECTTDSVTRLRSTLDNAIESISITLPRSKRWPVSRIDFTMNLTSEYVKECVALAKKGKDPYHYTDPVKKPGSSYRKSKSVVLNYYDKFDHVSKKISVDSSDAYLLEEAQNIYRIEVQCLNHNKLKHIRKRFDLPRRGNLYTYLRSDIAEWAFLSYYDSVIGRADYHSLAEAIKIVESKKWNTRKKENIVKWLKLIAQARSISKARQQFVDGTTLAHTKTIVKGSLNTFRNYEKACRDIDINPVTIPKDWGIKYIPNPIKSISMS
ncbi:hypothetical protein [Alkalihalobacillus sp. 1P02AB]|uniref:hypothetical protein n=1 Tax=Alkalihalobacillus sp. 1P02AB TaxID=3132260 RepID=UPI0039A58CB9